MGKLRTVQPRLRMVGARLVSSAPSRDVARARQKPWRRWYSTAAWKRLRVEVMQRDKMQCQATGVMLTTGRDKPNAAVVDHIEPHRGDRKLFFDVNNLRLVAKSWHDREKQKIERAIY